MLTGRCSRWRRLDAKDCASQLAAILARLSHPNICVLHHAARETPRTEPTQDEAAAQTRTAANVEGEPAQEDVEPDAIDFLVLDLHEG